MNVSSGRVSKFAWKSMAALAVALGLATTGYAQSAKGHLMGDAATGDTIVVDRIDGGFHREIVARRDGKYHVRSLSPGRYRVLVMRADGSAAPARVVVVQVGTTARVK